MTIRPITIYGEPVLHRRAQEVERIDDSIRELVADMVETQDAAHGVGLAAPQVGVGLRIFTYSFADSGDQPSRGVIINPRLRLIGKVSKESADPEEESEGCLSAPGYNYPLKRSEHVEITGLDLEGEPLQFEATGWFARILQHEYDHLDGYLYVNRLDPRWARRWKKVVKKEGWNQPGLTWLPGVDPDPFGHDEPEDDHESDSGSARQDVQPEGTGPSGRGVSSHSG
ncbi:peptide deformylase [Nesterenkonia sandarakina]|uniref:Peptide deformylase n=1 Tax=Nesterenkonia sandarakina TaxID=272918 RepID=A0A2T0YLP4_9MICC|nr:peptide deformylase [Nesterenkonia sandarakina]PRZ16147.1 peptide deformylase [Nesterenkonia sandarakina]